MLIQTRETDMTRAREKLLLATLAGLIIACAAAFAVSPTLAADHFANSYQISGF